MTIVSRKFRVENDYELCEKLNSFEKEGLEFVSIAYTSGVLTNGKITEREFCVLFKISPISEEDQIFNMIKNLMEIDSGMTFGRAISNLNLCEESGDNNNYLIDPRNDSILDILDRVESAYNIQCLR